MKNDVYYVLSKGGSRWSFLSSNPGNIDRKLIEKIDHVLFDFWQGVSNKKIGQVAKKPALISTFGRSNFAAVVLQQELVQQKFKQMVAICAKDPGQDLKVPYS